MNNFEIADLWARKNSSMLKKGGVWLHNLGPGKSQRKNIIKIYKKHFSKVVYDIDKDICTCYK